MLKSEEAHPLPDTIQAKLRAAIASEGVLPLAARLRLSEVTLVSAAAGCEMGPLTRMEVLAALEGKH
jgi:hypothetical protein